VAPKFKGDVDDWLDDQSLRKKSNRLAQKTITARSLELPWNDSNGTVEEVFPKQCRVRFDLDQKSFLCSYRWAEVVSKSKTDVRQRTPVCVGDRVLAKQTGDNTGVIEGICSRKNSIVRPAPGRDGKKHHHALAANLDLLAIVASTREPDFSPGLIDRFLVAAEMEQIPILICISKVDLMSSQPLGFEQQSIWKKYRELGYEVVEFSSKTGLGLNEVVRRVEGKSVAFCGPSGVGKTSMLAALLNRNVGRVAQVNAYTGKGKHTTTGAILLDGPQNSRWIDTPGVREFGLSEVEPQALSRFFPEFQGLRCQAHGCLHDQEVECQARNLFRYSSYLRILKSLILGEF
jgi:ribosome biogenesis GTPase